MVLPNHRFKLVFFSTIDYVPRKVEALLMELQIKKLKILKINSWIKKMVSMIKIASIKIASIFYFLSYSQNYEL